MGHQRAPTAGQRPGPGQGKVQFKEVTRERGGLEGAQEYSSKASHEFATGRFRHISNRGTTYEQHHLWGGEWRRKHPKSFGLDGKLSGIGAIMSQCYHLPGSTLGPCST